MAQGIKKSTWQGRMWKFKSRYILVLPALFMTLIFNYYTMYGIMIAFKNYRIRDGIMGSHWANPLFRHFESVFADPRIWPAIRNTVIMSAWHLVWGTAIVIFFALLVNELRNQHFKKTVQTISYLPNFLSWIVIASLFRVLFHPSLGIMNNFLDRTFGFRWYALVEADTFRALVYTSSMWRGLGFGTIIYLAAMGSINVELHESAVIDGAHRFQRMWHVTIQGIRSTILLLFILECGNILGGNFEQIFNLMEPQTRATGDIIDTFVWRMGIVEGRFEIATAVGLMRNVLGLALLLSVNGIVKFFGEDGIL